MLPTAEKALTRVFLHSWNVVVYMFVGEMLSVCIENVTKVSTASEVFDML